MTVSRQTILLRLAVFLVVATALLYAGDFISLRLRLRHTTATDPFETLPLRTSWRLQRRAIKGIPD